MPLNAIQLAWRVTGALFYALSAGLSLLFLLRHAPGEVPLLSPLARAVDRRLSRFHLAHTIAVSLLVVGSMAVLHWFTLRFHEQHPGVINNYGDFDPHWRAPAELALRGGNPYSTPDGQSPNFANSINFGILFVGMNMLGFALGGAYGIILVYCFGAFLLPIAVHSLAREYLEDRRHQAYAVLLSVFIPQSLFYMVRLVQDEPFTLLPVLGSLVLVRRNRLFAAAGLAGTLAAVKYAPLMFLAAFLILHYKRETADIGFDSGRRRLLLVHLAALLLAAGIFLAGLAVGTSLYGQDFLSRTLGMTRLLDSIAVLTLLDNLRGLISPLAINLALATFVLALLITLGVRNPAGDAGDTIDLTVALVLFLALSTLFMKVNPEYVGLMIGLGLVHFIRRHAAITAITATTAPPRRLTDWLYSPLFPLGLSVLADAQIWWCEFHRPPDFVYQGPLIFRVLFTLAFGLLAWELFPRLATRRRAARPPLPGARDLSRANL